jgi:hypothetical protein
MTRRCLRRQTALLSTALAVCLNASRLVAQGCEPIRFTTPVNLGGEGKAYQPAREWQLTIAYRNLESEDWYVGRKSSPTQAPFGVPGLFKIHTIVGDVAYSVNDRMRVRLSVPVQTASFRRLYADRNVHEQSVTGIGDIGVMTETWVFDPRTSERGNVSIGLGVKAPTGSNNKMSKFFTATSAIDFPADQTIQAGDGGWAVLTHAQAFRQVSERAFVYTFGSYMISPKAQSNVVFAPGSTVHWSVPDVYSARAGAAFSVLSNQRLTMSLGSRIDGIPVRDLIGGGDDDTIKRTSYVVFADPGLSVVTGRGTFTLSTPIRVAVNRKKSLFEQKTNAVNGGGFAQYLVFASYSHRL